MTDGGVRRARDAGSIDAAASRGRPRRVPAPVDAAPDGVHPAGPQPLRDACPFCAAPQHVRRGRRSSSRRGTHGVRAAQPVPVQLRPSARLPVPPHRARTTRRRPRRSPRSARSPSAAMRVLRTVSRCDGFNIGMNQGQRRRRRHRRAPAPAHRAAVGGRRELLPDHREDQGAAAAARRSAPHDRRRLARLNPSPTPVRAGPPRGSPPRRCAASQPE